MLDYHRFETQYQASIVRMWKSKIQQEDKEAIELFLKDCRSEGVGFARLRKLIQVLTCLGKRFKDGILHTNEKELRQVILHYEEGDYSFWTRHDVKVILKQFLKWNNKGVYPKCTDWIFTTIPRKQKIQPRSAELLTEDEVTKAIEATDNPRNKALIAVLAESGARPGELGNLTIN